MVDGGLLGPLLQLGEHLVEGSESVLVGGVLVGEVGEFALEFAQFEVHV